MPKINQLSFAVANLIAAGEVVDRPASVVKELLENAIDAGATSITVEIAHGGVGMIRVSDNGCGMEKEDLPIAIKRHATSKISGAEDLESIMTLGFRGEALAAISSVSRIRILSRTKDAETGYLLTSSCGTNVEICEVGCAAGTTVIVEDLFYNVPARRKFLKKDVTEAIAVSSVVEKIALSKPEISFTYSADGQIRLTTAGDGNVKNALYAVFGRDFAGKLIPLDSCYDGIHVHGYTGRSDNCRANRNMQNFFVNGRYVRSKTAMAALEQAYASYIAEGKFPVCAVFIDVPPFHVDVNVHPAKLEVKFSNEKLVFEAVYYSVRSAIENHTEKSNFTLPPKGNDSMNETKEAAHASNRPSLRPATGSFVALKDEEKKKNEKETITDGWRYGFSDDARIKAGGTETLGFFPPASSSFKGKAESRTVGASLLWENTHFGIKDTASGSDPFSFAEQEQREKPAEEKTVSLFTPSPETDKAEVLQKAASAEKETLQQAVQERAVANEDDTPAFPVGDTVLPSYRIIGVCFNTYILVEEGTTLLLIDKHAAHERIIFEQLKENLHRSAHASQLLLIPIDLSLSPEEFQAAKDYGDEIRRAGFDFSLDEKREVHISMIPDLLTTDAATDLFIGILGDIAGGTGDAVLSRDALYERALYQASCKAAVKGGRADLFENIRWICDTLMAIPDIRVCPHGRPVVTVLEKRYIDRQFDRIK